MEWAVVSRESHDDGSPHLHSVVSLKDRLNVRAPDALDFIGGKHGDYKSARGALWKVVQYVIKDGDFVATEGFDPAAFVLAGKRKRSSKASIIGDLILKDDKVTIRGLAEEYPGFWLMHAKTLEAALSTAARWRAAASVPGFSVIPTAPLTGHSLAIAEWLNQNLLQPRAFKQPQLYIVGVAGSGKTHLINQLRDLLPVYTIPTQSEWDDHYEDGAYQLAVLDEFKRQKTRAYILEWLQGGSMFLKRKGVPGYLKRQNIPTIILSNYTPEELYDDPKYSGTLEPLLARLKVITIPRGERIDVWPTPSRRRPSPLSVETGSSDWEPPFSRLPSLPYPSMSVSTDVDEEVPDSSLSQQAQRPMSLTTFESVVPSSVPE